MELNTVLFIGKPGSGKGTQSKLLAQHTGWQVISTGDLFRGMAKEDSVVGRKTKDVIDNGFLMPPWFAIYLFQRAIFEASAEQGLIFEGSGRKPSEAELIVETLEWLGRPFKAVHIKVSDEDIVTRLTGRRGEEARADDNEITKRLEEYRTYTDPAIDVFRKSGHLIEVDGTPSPEEIAAEVRTQIGF
jgi:adenylate kinase